MTYFDISLGTLKNLELSLMFLGIICVSLSLYASHKFWRVKRKFSRALSFNIISEFVVGCFIIMFGASSWLYFHNKLPEDLVLIARTIMLLLPTVATVNLVRHIIQIEEDDEGNASF